VLISLLKLRELVIARILLVFLLLGSVFFPFLLSFSLFPELWLPASSQSCLFARIENSFSRLFHFLPSHLATGMFCLPEQNVYHAERVPIAKAAESNHNYICNIHATFFSFQLKPVL
jgi:hypothetical protein